MPAIHVNRPAKAIRCTLDRYKHVLMLLADKKKLLLSQVADALEVDFKTAHTMTNFYVRRGLVERTVLSERRSLLKLTPEGYDYLGLPRPTPEPPPEKRPVAPPIRFRWGEGNYDGAELRPYLNRPGANVALTLPSRFGDKLRYRDGREVQLG